VTTAAPQDQLRLLDLQALDTRLQQLAHAKKTHPTLARIAELDKQIADLHGSLVDSRTAVTDLRRELAKAEADVEQVVTRTARNQQRLDSGTLGAKDALAVTEEMASLARRQGVLEEAQLEVMEKLDAHQDALDKVEAAHQELVDAKTAAEAERDAAFEEINAQGRAVTVQRKDVAAAIDAGLVTVYDQLRTRLGGVGAAALRAGRCEGCGLELNPGDLAAARSAAPDQVVRCEECGRILVRVTES
jgi:predicted  nucleic acid-binding Zn-ribbon protein